MPLDDRIRSVSVNPLGQIQHTREVQDEHRRKKRERNSSEKRKKDTIELSIDTVEQSVATVITEVKNPEDGEQTEDTKPHIDIVIH
ncbi:MAG: hypothetical protein GXO91_05290 [FCB group bacterium]|nr:hypothetical protein [FCB group bacterium]